jgi:PAS domain S-box-containing protein
VSDASVTFEIEAVGSSLASAGIGVFLASPSGDLLWVNAALREAIGPLSARSLDDLFEGGWGTKGQDAAAAWPSPGAERTVRLKGDPPRYFRFVTSPWLQGARLGIVVDATAGVLRDEERAERDFYLTRAARDSADAFVSLDEAGRIRQWNDGARQMFGHAAEEVLGHPYDELLVPEALREKGDLSRIDEQMERDGYVRGYETMRMSKDGRLIPVEVTVTRLVDESGSAAGRSVIYRDISERIGLEAALRKTVEELKEANQNIRSNQERLIALEKLSAIGEMSAKVAHEIRTPLVTIGGFANTLLREIPPESPARQYLEIIREEVRRLEVIVAEILEYVRPPRADLESCDLNDIVRQSLRPFEEAMVQKRISAIWKLMENLPDVRANRYQLQQVFSNLLQNAVQAMSEGGVLTVETGTGPNYAMVSVSDTGPGISGSNRKRIFRPFFTTKPSGSGLGLAISSQIVAQLNGTISFDSVEGRGTTFEVRLPLSMEAAG